MPGEIALRFLQQCARLLLEYNLRSALLERQIHRLASHLGADVRTLVAYRDVTLVTADGRNWHAQAPELRINIAVSLGTSRVIDAVRANRLGLEEASRRLEPLERMTPRHGPWLLAVTFGLAASALATLLHADIGAIAVSGVSSGLGLIARQELGRRRAGLFTLPFSAALIGAALGGIVIRLGWTGTPGLCLVVPALMLVPGPHFINGVADLAENHMRTGVCRLGLSVVILMAAALGVLLGSWLTLDVRAMAGPPVEAIRLPLALDVVLAGVAACGFGAFYNAPWRVLWISILCGMLGVRGCRDGDRPAGRGPASPI